jgi:hypothetical protein
MNSKKIFQSAKTREGHDAHDDDDDDDDPVRSTNGTMSTHYYY